MEYIRLASQTDFKGWRDAARRLVLANVKPADVTWSVDGDQALLFDSTPAPVQAAPASSARFNVPKAFIELAEHVILNSDPERFALLYRLLWRLRDNPDLLHIATDPDVARAEAMAKAVRRDEHKMHAFVRFREIGRERDSHYVAWFEPSHHIVELAAPFFARRFADMEWSILTPERSAHWNGHTLSFTSGVPKSEAPSEDRLEEIWRTYYANIFNPARLKTKAMRAEMPKKYWRNLPEASLIKPLIEKAERTMQTFIDADAEPAARKMQAREAQEPDTDNLMPSNNLQRLKKEAASCRDCHLWKDATQTVFGEGPPGASVMLVGEQPGDKEDLAGKPFVGPAGQMLNRALAEAGIDRTKVYVTNAVKHFKFVPRGKIRLHQKPATPEIKACRQWYERELAAVKPVLVVAMGATAAQSVFGKITPINKTRGRIVRLESGQQTLVTVHPSYLLRLPDQDAKEREYARFVEDLKIAAEMLNEMAA